MEAKPSTEYAQGCSQHRDIIWVKHNYSTYASVTQVKESLGWRSLEQKRADGQVTMFYTIVYGLVSVPLPAYIIHPEVIIRHMHPLFYRQIHTNANYYKYSFYPWAISYTELSFLAVFSNFESENQER